MTNEIYISVEEFTLPNNEGVKDARVTLMDGPPDQDPVRVALESCMELDKSMLDPEQLKLLGRLEKSVRDNMEVIDALGEGYYMGRRIGPVMPDYMVAPPDPEPEWYEKVETSEKEYDLPGFGSVKIVDVCTELDSIAVTETGDDGSFDDYESSHDSQYALIRTSAMLPKISIATWDPTVPVDLTVDTERLQTAREINEESQPAKKTEGVGR